MHSAFTIDKRTILLAGAALGTSHSIETKVPVRPFRLCHRVVRLHLTETLQNNIDIEQNTDRRIGLCNKACNT